LTKAKYWCQTLG